LSKRSVNALLYSTLHAHSTDNGLPNTARCDPIAHGNLLRVHENAANYLAPSSCRFSSPHHGYASHEDVASLAGDAKRSYYAHSNYGRSMAHSEDQPSVKTCFVVCPIGAEGSSTRKHADWLLHEIVEYVLDRDFEGEFEVIRADKIDQPGMIDAQIIAHLLDDDLVIADMSELNPNVFYEMGIRQMKERPIIHMCKKGETIPFDVKLYRAVYFEYAEPIQLRAAREDLARAVKAVLAPDHKVDNPVIRARGVQKLQETATPEIAVVTRLMQEMDHRVQRLEADNGYKIISNTSKGPVPQYVIDVAYAVNLDSTDVKLLQSRLTRLAMSSFGSVRVAKVGDVIRIQLDGSKGSRIDEFMTAIGELPEVHGVEGTPMEP
jgi:hypothetical protein